MSFLRGDSYDSTTVVKLVAAVDIVRYTRFNYSKIDLLI